MANEMIQLMIPVASQTEATLKSVSNLMELQGKVIGFIDNIKPNFNILVNEMVKILEEKKAISSVLIRRKAAASLSAPKEMLDELAHSCDIVIAGSGD